MAKIWTEDQRHAIEYSNRNILVSAAAGSGKTAVLVERIISKITDKENPVDIDRLVVVTFTKAAAAQMRERIRRRLDEMADESPEDMNLVKQITLINNAQITTIDSFCLWIIRNHFAEINLDPGFRAADNGEITLLENDVMGDMLEEYYSSHDEEFLNFVDSYGTGRDDISIEEIIKKIYSYGRSTPWPEEWYDGCMENYSNPENEGNPVIADLYESIMTSVSDYKVKYEKLIDICSKPGGPYAYLEAIQSDYLDICRVLDSADFEEMAENILSVNFKDLSRKKMMEATEESKDYIKSQRDLYKNYINGLKKNVFMADTKVLFENVKKSYSAISMMIRLAKDFNDRMMQSKKDRGIIDFNDMEHFALNILVEKDKDGVRYTKTAKELSLYFNEILIDEYQDSNQLQEAILMSISGNNSEDMYNNVYMVGDVKQSIYKFRLACPELFMKKYNTYTVGESDSQKIELSMNFRSRKNILDSVNDVFGRVMNPKFGGIDYNRGHGLNAGFDYGDTHYRNFGMDEEKATEVCILDDNDDDDSVTGIEKEGKYITARINEMMCSKEPYYIYDDEEGEYRQLCYKDITVLTRTVAGWSDTLVNVLQDGGIPAICDSSQGYFSVREIKTLLSLLTCINNPLQNIPMAGVMLSYFGRFGEDELVKLKKYNKDEQYLYNQVKKYNGDDEVLLDKCHTFISNMTKYREHTVLQSIYDLLWDIVYNSGYYDYIGMMPAGEGRQRNVDILLDKAASFEGTSYSGLFNFLRYVERLKKFDIPLTDSASYTDGGNSVRIMSIHKSKGLEFPVVIVAGINKSFNRKDIQGKIVIDQELGIGACCINPEKKTKTSTIIRGAIMRKLLRDSIAEEQRVLYVAMTRPREKMILVGHGKNSDKKYQEWNRIKQEIIKEGEMSYSTCENIKCYADMIMPVVMMDESMNKGKFCIIKNADEIMDKYQDSRILAETSEPEDTKREERSKDAEDVLPEYVRDVNDDRKIKITVSELKQMQHDADFKTQYVTEEIEKGADADIEEDNSDGQDEIIPKFIKGESGRLQGNDRGTAYHRVMECLDYNISDTLEGIKCNIELLVQQEKLSKLQADCIKPSDIWDFVNSETGNRVKNALKDGKVRREQPFIFKYDGQLVQGVVDLYFIEEGQIVIVDYKTDRVKVSREGEKELINRYKIQLDYYGMALEQLTGLKVKEKIIYSFTLGRSILLE